jgi:hypothetical protein
MELYRRNFRALTAFLLPVRRKHSRSRLPHKYAVIFLVIGMVCIAYAALTSILWLRVAMGWSGIAFIGIGLAYAGIGPRMLLKRSDGRLSPLSYLIYTPYFLLNEVSYWLVRWKKNFVPFTEITPGLLLGCRLRPGDARTLEPFGVSAVLDLTSEFTEPIFLRCREAYLCLPILDTCPPTWEQLTEGVAWIQEQRDAGRTVYVHCALGHGRSALFVMAYLIHTRAVSTEKALAHVQEQRPGVCLSSSQASRLREIS